MKKLILSLLTISAMAVSNKASATLITLYGGSAIWTNGSVTCLFGFGVCAYIFCDTGTFPDVSAGTPTDVQVFNGGVLVNEQKGKFESGSVTNNEDGSTNVAFTFEN